MNERQWGELEEQQRRSDRIRERFGLTPEHDGDASDWLLGPGAVPAALVVVALLVYAVISVVAGVW